METDKAQRSYDDKCPNSQDSEERRVAAVEVGEGEEYESSE